MAGYVRAPKRDDWASHGAYGRFELGSPALQRRWVASNAGPRDPQAAAKSARGVLCASAVGRPVIAPVSTSKSCSPLSSQLSTGLYWCTALIALRADRSHAPPPPRNRRPAWHGLTIPRRRLGQLSAAAAVAAINRPAQAARINSEGFAFDAPDGFEAKPKPVKTHAAEVLYKNGKREIGVVVDRVRIEQLSDFGTPAFVGDKVVASERERDGITAAELSKAVDSGMHPPCLPRNRNAAGAHNFGPHVAGPAGGDDAQGADMWVRCPSCAGRRHG